MCEQLDCDIVEHENCISTTKQRILGIIIGIIPVGSYFFKNEDPKKVLCVYMGTL